MEDRGILIAGAGPTGLTAAVELARRGIVPRVIDRKSDPLALSRAVGINAHSLMLLEESGVSERLLAEGVQVRRARFHHGERLLVEIRLDRLNHKYNFMLCLPQDRTEAILLERFREVGGDVEFGVGLERLEQRDGKALATLRHEDGGRAEEAEVGLVLGADGARSTVRAAVGIAYDGFDLDGAWGIADVDSVAWPYHDRICGFMLPHGGMVVVLPIATQRYRVVANRERALEQVPGGMPVDTVRREGQFDIAIRQAPSYRQGCVFLAGDAAHCHSPAGVRGMNLGIADAVSFARRVSEDELAGYSETRHAHGRATIRASESGRRALTATNPLVRPIVRTVMRLAGYMPFLQKRIAREALDI